MQTFSLAKVAFIAGLLALSLATSSAAVSSLPSLFSRLRPAPRNQYQPQQLSQQQQQQVNPHEQILLAASSMAPAFNGYPHLRQGDLMRLSAMQVHQHQMQPAGFFPHMSPMETSAAQYRPQMNMMRQPVQQQVSAMNLPLENYRESNQNEHSFAVPLTSGEPILSPSGQMHAPRPLDTSHSEVVDKIERHIGQQIEASLSAGASAYQQGAAEHNGREQSPAASGEESEGEEEHHEEPKAEKRHEEHHHHHHHEEPEHKHEEHHEEHHESAPEAFEVHHKKGGKSFQYFHQGHSH